MKGLAFTAVKVDAGVFISEMNAVRGENLPIYNVFQQGKVILLQSHSGSLTGFRLNSAVNPPLMKLSY